MAENQPNIPLVTNFKEPFKDVDNRPLTEKEKGMERCVKVRDTSGQVMPIDGATTLDIQLGENKTQARFLVSPVVSHLLGYTLISASNLFNVGVTLTLDNCIIDNVDNALNNPRGVNPSFKVISNEIKWKMDNMLECYRNIGCFTIGKTFAVKPDQPMEYLFKAFIIHKFIPWNPSIHHLSWSYGSDNLCFLTNMSRLTYLPFDPGGQLCRIKTICVEKSPVCIFRDTYSLIGT